MKWKFKAEIKKSYNFNLIVMGYLLILPKTVLQCTVEAKQWLNLPLFFVTLAFAKTKYKKNWFKKNLSFLRLLDKALSPNLTKMT